MDRIELNEDCALVRDVYGSWVLYEGSRADRHTLILDPSDIETIIAAVRKDAEEALRYLADTYSTEEGADAIRRAADAMGHLP